MNSTKLSAVYEALEKRGQHAKAEELKRRVVERFKDVVPEKELLDLPVNDIVGILDLFNQLFVEASKPHSDNHGFTLKSQGFNIVCGANTESA